MGSGIVRKNDKQGTNVLLSLACIFIVIAGLKLASEICVPIALGLFLGVLSLPILNFFNEDCGIPRPMAIFLTIALDLLILGSIVMFASGVIPEFQEKGPEYAEKLKTRATAYAEGIDQQLEKLEGMSKFFGADPEVTGRTIPTFKEMFVRYWDTQRLVALINQTNLVERFTSLASKSFFVLILMVFVLAESKRYAEKVTEVIKVRGPNLGRFHRSSQDIQNYLLLKTLVSLLTGILAGLACLLLKVEFPLLWGLVAFLLNFIPVIGSIMAAIPPAIIALILLGFWPAFFVLAAYLAINILIGNFLEPKLLGDSFGISTTVVIISVLLWGYIWGLAGMFLAVPLTMMVKVMLDNTPEMKWLSVMISSGKEENPDGPIGRLQKKSKKNAKVKADKDKGGAK